MASDRGGRLIDLTTFSQAMFPGAANLGRVIDIADRFLVSSAQANAASALAAQRAYRLEHDRDDFDLARDLNA